MSNFYISDLHIGHSNVIKLDNRPFKNLNEMHEEIIKRWNRAVKTTDTVYIVGDFIWYKESMWPYYVEPLAGNKVLIRGNHDPRQFSSATKRLFQDITNLKEIEDGDRRVVMCHYPIPCYRGSYNPNSYMLYGHVHQTNEYEYMKMLRQGIISSSEQKHPTGNFINVGCMLPYMDYTPRTLDEIIFGDTKYTKERNT